MSSKHTNFSLKIVILSAFFLSGLSALIYEVVWMRLLSLTFGTTVFAVSTVLTAFMAGLALGSFVFGKFVDRTSISPIKLYLILEICIGIFGLASPFLFNAVEVVYMPLVRHFFDSFYLFSIFRFFIVFLIVLTGTAIMGATLPVLSKFFVSKTEDAGLVVGRLYGINTFGAVVGTFTAGFFLIPYLGVWSTLLIAVALNLLIGFGIYFLFKGEDVLESRVLSVKKKPMNVAEDSKRSRLILIGFAISGFSALAYEVVWTKILALIIGSSVYAFSTMLVTFLLGLALGSYVMSKNVKRFRGSEFTVFALVQLLIALSVLVALFFIGKLPIIFLEMARVVPRNFLGIQIIQFAMAFAIMFVPTFLLGTVFPLCLTMYTQTFERVGEDVGRLYAYNTFGTIFGSFCTGFIFIPLLGTENSLKIIILINLTLSLFFLIKFSKKYFFGKLKVALPIYLFVCFLFFIVPKWNPLAMNSNFSNLLAVAVTDAYYKLQSYLDSEIIYTDEDVTTSVLIFRDKDGFKGLHVGGHAEGGNSIVDLPAHVKLAAIPALLHKNPKDTLMIGLGAGVTLGSLSQMDGVETMDVVELSGAVVQANSFFVDDNHDVLNDERTNLIVDDGRHFLQSTKKQYDLIISGPSYSWVSGTSNLFTKEFFELSKSRIKDDGLVAMWFQIYNVTPDHVKTFLKTAANVFPNVSVWMSGTGGELIVIGSKTEHGFDYPLLKERLSMEKVKNEIERVAPATVDVITSFYLMDSDKIEEIAGEAPLNTDNRPRLEFSMPRRLFDVKYSDILDLIVGYKTTVFAPVRNISSEKDGYRYFDMMGLRTSLEKREMRAGYMNVFRFAPVDREGNKKFFRNNMVRLDYKNDKYVLALMASNGFKKVEEGDIESITGLKGLDVKEGVYNGSLLYYASIDKKNNGFAFIFSCENNEKTYYGNLQIKPDGGERGFLSVKTQIEKEFVCYDDKD